jgi:hypothetical protein
MALQKYLISLLLAVALEVLVLLYHFNNVQEVVALVDLEQVQMYQ